MDWSQVAVLAGIVGTNLAATLAIYYHFEARVNKVYSRFDQHKEFVERCFVKKDMCDMLHRTTADNLTGLETRLEKRFDKMELLMSDTMTKIMHILANNE